MSNDRVRRISPREIIAKVDGQNSASAASEFRAPATLELSADAKAAVESGAYEQRKIESGQRLWLAWKAAPGKTSWEEFQKINSHIVEHPLTNSGSDIRPGYPYLVKKEVAAAAEAKPGWNAKGAKAAPADVKSEAPTAAAKSPALEAAEAKLKENGYEPTPASLKPDALAAELTKRTLNHTSMDYDFMNAALGYAHASGTVEALNTAVAGQLAGRPATDEAATTAKSAAQKLGAKDGSLRALIGMQTSDAAKKASEDVLTTGVDQHRSSTSEKVGEQFIRLGKSIGESFRDDPVKATRSLVGGVALVAAVPFLAAGAAAGAMLLAGGTLAAAAASGAAFGAVATGVVGVAATAYGVHKGLTAAEKFIDANSKTGAARDEALQGVAGDLIGSAAGLGTAFKLRPRIVGPGAPPPPPIPGAPQLGGPPSLPRLGLSPGGAGVSPSGTPALPPPDVSVPSVIFPAKVPVAVGKVAQAPASKVARPATEPTDSAPAAASKPATAPPKAGPASVSGAPKTVGDPNAPGVAGDRLAEPIEKTVPGAKVTGGRDADFVRFEVNGQEYSLVQRGAQSQVYGTVDGKMAVVENLTAALRPGTEALRNERLLAKWAQMMPGAKVVGSEQGKVTFELNGQQYRASMGPERTPQFEVARGNAFQPTKALDATQAAARRENLVLDAAGKPGDVFSYESLGYENVARQAGVQSFTHPNGSTIKFPRWGGSDQQNWAPGEREKLTSALRDGRSYTHPDVAQAAASGREAGTRFLRENLGQSTSTHDETFSALGYERVRQAGVAAFTNPQSGATISVPAPGSAMLRWPVGEQDKLVKALREGGSYTHPDVARAAAAGREAAIGDLAKNLGSTGGYNAQMFEALGYQRAIGARGNVTFTNSSNGSTVTLPPQQGRVLDWAAGEQAQLMKALREGGQYTHPAARSS